MQIQSQVRTIGNISRVILRGPGDLRIVQASQPGLTITAPAEIIEDITSDIVDATLHLGYRDRRVVPLDMWRQEISFLLHVEDLNQISSLGSGRIQAADFDSDNLEVNVSGSGEIVIDDLTSDTLVAVLSGSGSVSLGGDVENQKVTIKGSGYYFADNLLSDIGCLRISGSGTASVSVGDQLDILISGSGNVNYHGFPEIRKQILGSGAVHRVRKGRKTVRAE
jgi:hypothetical protein